MKEFLADYLPKMAGIIPGLMGGVVSLTLHKNLTFKKALIIVGVGAIFAAYATDFVVKATGMDNGLAGFLIGLVAMQLTVFVDLYAKKIFKKKLDNNGSKSDN